MKKNLKMDHQTGKPYVSIAQWGNCKVCGVYQDLRCGICFLCADKVTGEQISPTTHKLWEKANPSNEWYYSTDGH
jgi:hypothetical protein